MSFLWMSKRSRPDIRENRLAWNESWENELAKSYLHGTVPVSSLFYRPAFLQDPEIHCLESGTSIIFCTPLSEYNNVLLEELKTVRTVYNLLSFVFPSESFTQNRMAESLILFNSIINSWWFLRTPITLFLVIEEQTAEGSSYSLFAPPPFSQLTLPPFQVPLEKYFPEYTAGSATNKAAKYILWQFMQANRAWLSVYLW